MRGTLYGIGVGPGDPELITLKALKCLEKSDVIILPAAPKEECYAYQIVYRVYPEIEEKKVLCMPFLMSKNKEELTDSHRQIYEYISTLLEQGKTICFLTIGDPSIYSTYSYIHKKERSRGGYPVMISGVPSFCAAAAAMGISLADNKEQIHIIPASYEIEETLYLKGTKVYMKSGKQLRKLKQMLLNKEGEGKHIVYSISNCGMPNERLVCGAENIDEDNRYLTTVILKEKC